MPLTTLRIHQMTVAQWERAFPSEDYCAAYLVRHRWPMGVRCPRCGSDKVFDVSTMDFKWQCYSCAPGTGYRFSHLTRTIFENTRKPLRNWFRVIHVMLLSKKGVSVLQVHRTMGFGSYESAWYMCHRVRGALGNEDFRKLMGVVDIDETYTAGKGNNRHGRHDIKRGPADKFSLTGSVVRGSNVVARILGRATKAPELVRPQNTQHGRFKTLLARTPPV